MVAALLLALYGLVLVYLTLFMHTGPRELPWASRLRLWPGRTIVTFLQTGGWPMVVNIVGNLAAFVPLGFLWPLLRTGKTRAGEVACLAAAVSLVIEVLQLGLGHRVADVDDVVLNALGGLIGFGAYRLCCLVGRGFAWLGTSMRGQSNPAGS
jgi:glycopeptide antibiotics resistance protein